ncbi:hypothetical protein VOLCADRAFT_92068 [Volvox carteri f. nagariensis]|uniref:Endonuclease/exonuclease/phosphatase domain-containing protein n=1 Tax=Volvox carteri f. nagariensis TaxID=3068 RepID=D8TZ12_VOLCA|nr:uncharacterized protein VOLCADRAFT_92068 [Volvox carteri f. nagariensis]EFJ47404.1 hypothetical protein VOLCADRAFT_92068 [Volvox carteri f. nagariensis]|eukprot:XP_002951593.1 hypothetical protein VOLCADRAFT_92068 [Volvox carteri f. nagariensis]
MVPAVILSAGLAALSWIAVRKLLLKDSRQKRARRIRRPAPLLSSEPDEISLIVYNILADHYCTPKRYPYVRPEWLHWPHRWEALQEQIRSFGSDLICLQEVEPSRWNQMLASPALTDYAGFLQLGLVWHESRTRALLAAFTFWDGLGQQQLLYVANMHLEGSPYRPNDRISQTRSALQRLEAHQRQYGIAPEDAAVVVCGDFNSGRHETVCHFLHRGRLEGGTTEPHMPKVEVTKASISHPYALHEAYSSGGHELPFTRKVPPLASTLDFIWASCQLEVAALYWPVECRHEGLIEHQALPNQHYPSDHLPIGAVLRLKHFYVPPYGDAHPPLPPPSGAQPDATQEYSSGPECDASELGLRLGLGLAGHGAAESNLVAPGQSNQNRPGPARLN